ncbi:polysaccharide lyase family 7 protein [Streptomyces sp. 6N223]|uniref:polysaccharide lyase family 7 protein n=1 Tax=Streptomyces sp. 6N223 TaxID=3457412 RepID=UPI003FCFA2E3
MTRRRIIALASITAAASAGALALPAQADTPTAREAQGAQCQYPADVLDLSSWRMTVPTGEDENPDDIDQPELATYSAEPWFQVNEDCSAVIFRSPVNGVTTEGSDYPRAELREMTEGAEEAAWSADDGTHVMVVREAIVALPNDKPHVVSAQVHGGDDDLTVFRLEGSSLYITNGDDSNHHLVTDNYELGTEFEAKFVAHDGVVDAYYNGELQTTIEAEGDGNYFKAGAYTQANCENSSPCDEGNFGEVHISSIELSDDPNAGGGSDDGSSGGGDDGGDSGDDGDSGDSGDDGDGGDDGDAGDSDDGASGSDGDGSDGADEAAGSSGSDGGEGPSTQTGGEANEPDLANTGGSSTTPALIAGGLGLLAAGGAALLIARRRAGGRAAA